MVTSTFGKLFLDAYNEKYGTHYDAKTFFVEIYWPLFFDHNKYMMSAGNSPFENPKISWDKMLIGQMPYESSEQRKKRFNNFMQLVSNGVKDNRTALDHPTENLVQATSGQISNIQRKETDTEILLSWIGTSLAIGVPDRLCILFNNKDILLVTFEGWKFYREVLENTTTLKGNQINSWNGLWLAHRYNCLNYHSDNPMDKFNNYLVTKDSSMSVNLCGWTELLSAIAQTHSTPKMLGYVFNFGQTNTTIGFIPFSLEPIRKTAQLYSQLFSLDEYSKDAVKLLGTAVGFKKSCQAGAIGVKALEPKGLADYVKGKTPREKDLKEETNIHTYITWILVMLNNQELWGKAQTIASALKDFSESGEKGRTDRKNKVKQVLEATNKRNFIGNLTEVVKLVDDNREFVNAAELINQMPAYNVPYFLTLIRFHYAKIK